MKPGKGDRVGERSSVKEEHRHGAGCGCNSVLGNMFEEAGHKLSRREFIAGAAVTAGIVAAGCCTVGSGAGPGTGPSADTIYHGGPIVTMVKDGHRVDALAVKDGKILRTGTKAEVLETKGSNTRVIDLQGRCLMPGFIDPHSHVVMQSAKFAAVNLDPKPIGAIGSIADIQGALREHIAKNRPAPGKWVIGWGYDDTGIKDMRHPTRQDLDAVSTEHPILLVHISNHLCAVNSRLLQEIGVTADTPDPEGGKFQREPGSRQPNGVLEELAMMYVVKKLPAPTPEQAVAMLEKGMLFYAAAGITTAQDGSSGPGAVKLLRAMDQAGRLPIDVVSYPIYKGVDQSMIDAIKADAGSARRFRLGGVKLAVDGSIQGYTAFLSQPYYVQPSTGQTVPDQCGAMTAERIFVSEGTAAEGAGKQSKAEAAHRGYSNMTQEEVTDWLRRCDAAGVQCLVHTNGDAATDMLVQAVGIVRKERARPDLRTVIIHGQTMREDQLDIAAKHAMIPSFFPIHITFWGDRHRDLFLGPERARRISPSRTALDRGMKVTLHHDAPIASIEMLAVASAAVNRVTSTGKELGPEQRITRFEALRAITADAAWQYFEEGRKGTLEAGKLADLVILSADPLVGDPMKMGDIQVLETIKEGQTVYKRS